MTARTTACALLAAIGVLVSLAASAPAQETRRLIVDLSRGEKVSYRAVNVSDANQDVDRWADGLAEVGFSVETAAQSPFTAEGLDGVAAVAILQPAGRAFSASELDVLRTFVERGGLVLAIGDTLMSTSGGTPFSGDSFANPAKLQEARAAQGVVNALLGGLGLSTRIADDVICSSSSTPSGSGQDGLDDLLDATDSVPESLVALRHDVGGGSAVGHFVGSSVTGAQRPLAFTFSGGGFYLVSRADAGEERLDPQSGRNRTNSCERARDPQPVGGGIAGVALDAVGQGKVITGGDLSFQAASYGSGAFYDNPNYGLRTFWNAVMDRNAPRQGVRMLDDGSSQPSPSSSGEGGAAGAEQRPQRGPESASSPAASTPPSGGGGGRQDSGSAAGGRRSGAAGVGRPAGSGEASGGGASRRDLGSGGRSAPAPGAAAPVGEAGTAGGGAPAAAGDARRLTDGEGDPLSAPAGTLDATGAAPPASATAAEGPPGWMVAVVGGFALAALAGGFALKRWQLQRVAF